MKILLTVIMFLFVNFAIAGLPVGKEEIAVVSYGTAISNDVSNVSDTTVTLWTIPAKTLVLDVTAYVTTAAVGGNITVGDGDDPDGFLTTGFEDNAGAYDINNTTYRGALLSSTTTPLLAKYYASADTVDVTLSATPLSAGKITYFIKYKRLK